MGLGRLAGRVTHTVGGDRQGTLWEKSLKAMLSARPNHSVGIGQGFKPGPFAVSARTLIALAAPAPRRIDVAFPRGQALCDLPVHLLGCQCITSILTAEARTAPCGSSQGPPLP